MCAGMGTLVLDRIGLTWAVNYRNGTYIRTNKLEEWTYKRTTFEGGGDIHTNEQLNKQTSKSDNIHTDIRTDCSFMYIDKTIR